MDIKKIKTIIKSKQSDKSGLGKWYEERLLICEGCEYNSKNKKELSAKDKIIVALNLGKDSCTACGCEIAAKTSVRSEICGLNTIGLPPKWTALPEIKNIIVDNNIVIENLSTDISDLIIEEGVVKILYKTLKYQGNSKVSLKFYHKNNEVLDNFRVKVGCGCTKSNQYVKNNNVYIDIEYDTKRIGGFEKNILFSFSIKEKETSMLCKINGHVNK